MDKFNGKYYSMSAQESNDKLSINKIGGSDWVNIEMETNDRENGRIEIRSKAMIEQLHFMLGQLLDT